MEPVISAVYESIVEGDAAGTKEKVAEALAAGIDPGVILNKGMITAMSKVGQLFEEGEYFVPEMLVAARAMQAGLALVKPLLVQADFRPIGKVVAGTVKGDLHDIGKNLVCMMLEGAAFEVVDLGVDVSPEKFVDAVKESGANIVAMSALLTTTMPNMKTTIEALRDAGVRGKVKVLVGGAPLTDQYAKEIGADGYAPDASRAVVMAKALAA